MDMEYWITGAFMIFASAGFWSFITRMLDKKSANARATLGICYLGVKMSCKMLLAKGWATTDEIEDIEKYIYEPYKAMGGNGSAERLMNKVRELPIKEEGENVVYKEMSKH